MNREKLREWRLRLPVNPFLLVALLIAIGWAVPKVMARAESPAEALAFTECPWFGDARVTVSPTVSAEDADPVRLHDNCHVPR